MSQRDRKKSGRLRRTSRFAEQAYCWRYVDHALVEAGQPCETRGYGVLAVVPPHQVDEIYTDAQKLKLHWQAIIIAYARTPTGEEYREWAWVRSEQRFRAEGDRITPLLEAANTAAMAAIDEGDDVYARAVLMSPWTARNALSPYRLASRLKLQIGLTDAELDDISAWGQTQPQAVKLGIEESTES